MCGHHWQKLFTSHFSGTSSCVNRLQPPFVTEVVGGKNTTEQLYNSNKSKHQHNFGCWLRNSSEPPKQTRNIKPVPFHISAGGREPIEGRGNKQV